MIKWKNIHRLKYVIEHVKVEIINIFYCFFTNNKYGWYEKQGEGNKRKYKESPGTKNEKE